MIDVKIIADSIAPNKSRITTYVLRYPRFIHSEFMTHRVFSRNTSSSRARPITGVIQEAIDVPVEPIFWGQNQKGMQSLQELPQDKKILAQDVWNQARLYAIAFAKRLNEIGLHKQYVNRILEPFTHVTVICTSTDYHNYFALRSHPDAQPEIQCLADTMLNFYLESKPKKLKVGEWHLPFCDKMVDKCTIEEMLKICTARCARVSYLNFEGDFEPQKDYDLHDTLAASGHWSPFEHATQALDKNVRCGNIRGYKQYRKFFSKENIVNIDLHELRKKRKK